MRQTVDQSAKAGPSAPGRHGGSHRRADDPRFEGDVHGGSFVGALHYKHILVITDTMPGSQTAIDTRGSGYRVMDETLTVENKVKHGSYSCYDDFMLYE